MSAGRLRGGGWRGLLGVALVLAVLIAACGDDGEVGMPTETTAGETTTATTVPAAETCPAEQRSALSDDWSFYRLTDLLVFFHPPGWIDHPPERVPAGEAFHPDNLGEAGLGSDATVVPFTVTDPSQLPGVRLVTLTGVTSPLDVVYARQEAHFLADFGTEVKEVLGTGLSGCLGDEPAVGLELLLDGDIVLQWWIAVRAGTLYQFLLVAVDEAQVALLDEVLRSWAWEDDAVGTPAAPDACRPDPPTALSTGWGRFHADDYAFSHPADWPDWSGVVTLQMAGLLDDATYAETGLAADATSAPTLVRDPTGFPNVAVFEFGAVASPLDEVHARLIAHMEAKEEVGAVATSPLPLCVGGEWAASLELEFVLADGEVLYQENWYVIHRGRLYLVQLLAEDADAAAVFHELLRTWVWQVADDTATPGEAADVFVSAHTATEADTSLDAPDPATFTSVFPPGTTRVYVVFSLEEGAFGEVQITWMHEGAAILESSTFYTTTTAWFSFSIFYTDGSALDPGDYEVHLEMEETGERVELSFRVEGD